MNATIFDYGAGNLHSLAKALVAGGARVTVEADPQRALATDLLVLPGVGAFEAACERLAPARDLMREALEGGLPCLAVCLGMQLLFDSSEEGAGQGLGLIRGSVRRLRAARVPQMGWNDIAWTAPENPDLAIAYYANSYVCEPADSAAVVAWSEHEQDRFPAAVRVARTLGVQFHPEKSSRAGIALIAGVVASATREPRLRVRS